MKLLALFTLLLISGNIIAQDLDGAWLMTHLNGKELSDKEFVKIYQDGYFSFGAKSIPSNAFHSAGGGAFFLEGSIYTETLDFHTEQKELVGEKRVHHIDRVEDKLVITGQDQGNERIEIWEKISDKADALTGNWVFTGRKDQEGELRTSTPGARRTVKILSGGRFQWIAFNSETKEFMGTGGGTYTAEDGEYTEHIRFFSRDNERVGASLAFEYEVKDGKWHHSGISSKGDPIYELWSPYKEAYHKSN
ncbi:hypothetical protein [Anditalea andensis]|uniref:Membrane protein n=1 Tax=Anditalea andensis TaxID=1048983 RepID=A0A074KU87_9BACT|nr:hypothetical protein [Anditalea andensis]KEO73536.1 membrane protein [Anditalea andensis]